MKIYNKLVRDLIPGIIKKDGENPKTRILDDEEYKKELVKKLAEEAHELAEATNDKKELIKEVGDVLEIIEAVIKTWDLSRNEIQKLKDERRKLRGAFDKKIFLETVE